MSDEQTIHLERYSSPAKLAVAAAQTLADEAGHTQVEPDHVLVVLLDRGHGKNALDRANFDGAAMLKAARTRLDALPRPRTGLAYLSSQTLKLLKHAEERATKEKRKNVDVECLFFALARLEYVSNALFTKPWPESEWGTVDEQQKPAPPTRTSALLASSKVLKDFVDQVNAAVSSPVEKLAPHAAATLAQIRRTLGHPVPPPRLVIETVHQLETKIYCENIETQIVLKYTHSGLRLEYGDQSITFQWQEDAMAWRSETGAELFATLEAFLVRFYPELMGV